MAKQTPAQLAVKRFNLAKDYWGPRHRQMTEDIKFLHGDQWNPAVKALRELDGRPCLVLPRLNAFVRQLNAINSQAKPAITLSSDLEGEVIASVEGLISSIENSTDAAFQYGLAGNDAIAGGLGALRVYSEYENNSSFSQNLRIEAILDPTSVYFDPASVEFDFADGKFVFIAKQVTLDELKGLVGDSAKVVKDARRLGLRKTTELAIDAETLTLLEYYWVETKQVTLYRYVYQGRDYITEIKLPDDDYATLISSRTINKNTVKYALFDGVELHNETEFPASRIPVIPVIGEQSFVAGQRIIKGAVQDSKHAQRVSNFAASVQLEIIDQLPKAPWLIDPDAIDGYEDEWRQSATRNFAYLPYKARSNSIAPTRAQTSIDTSPIASVKQQADDDMRNIFGVFETAVGDNPQAESGVALKTRIAQSSQATYVYRDNLYRAIREIGKVLVEAIPVFYGGRTVQVPTVDGKAVPFVVPQRLDPNVKVEIDKRPTSETAKQALTDTLMNIATKLPSAAPLVTDYVVANLDIPGKDKLVARLKTLLPDQVRQLESQELSQEDAASMVAALQQQAAQSTETVTKLTADAEALAKENELLKHELRMTKLAKDDDLAKAQLDYDVELKRLELDTIKLQLEYEKDMTTLRLSEQKIGLATTGIDTDALPSV